MYVILLAALVSIACSFPLPQADDLQAIDSSLVQIVPKPNEDPLPLEKIFDIGELFNEKYLHKKIAEICGILLPHLKGFPTLRVIILKIQEEVLRHSSITAILVAVKPIVENLFKPVLTKVVHAVVTGIITAVYNVFLPVREAAVLATTGLTSAGQVLGTQFRPQQFSIEIPDINAQKYYITPPQIIYRKRRDVQDAQEQTKKDSQLTSVLRRVKSFASDKKEDKLNYIKQVCK